MVILGIDPGLATTGWGVIKKKDIGMAEVVGYGCLTTDASEPHVSRLLTISRELKALIRKYQPDAVGVEELFFYKNAKTAFKVGEARGVVLLTAAELKVPVFEYTPLEVKQSMTGYGRADKQQMQRMVKVLLSLKQIPKPDDAADALAVALTCLQMRQSKLR